VLIGVVAAAYIGLAWLALALPRHWRDATGRPESPVRARAALRAAGATALVASFAMGIARDGWAFGSLVWVTVIAATAIGVAFTGAWRPRWLRVLALPFVGARAARGSTNAATGRPSTPSAADRSGTRARTR
jgi:hypothetical protein